MRAWLLEPSTADYSWPGLWLDGIEAWPRSHDTTYPNPSSNPNPNPNTKIGVALGTNHR